MSKEYKKVADELCNRMTTVLNEFLGGPEGEAVPDDERGKVVLNAAASLVATVIVNCVNEGKVWALDQIYRSLKKDLKKLYGENA